MRGAFEGTKLVYPGEGEFWGNLTAILFQLRQGYGRDSSQQKNKKQGSQTITSCRRGNPTGLKGK